MELHSFVNLCNVVVLQSHENLSLWNRVLIFIRELRVVHDMNTGSLCDAGHVLNYY